MRRLVVISLCFAVTLGAFAFGARATLDTRALAAADELYARRKLFADRLARAARKRRHVLVMGDSTIMLGATWPARTAPQLRRRGVDVVVSSGAGRDFFHHYCLLPALLEHDPDVVVLVANLRVFQRGRRMGRNIDVCSHLPPNAWPRATMLPWHDRGVTLPRVVLARLLTVPWVEDWFLFTEGTRRLFADVLGSGPPPRRPAGGDSTVVFLEELARTRRAYAQPVTQRHPVVRMMRATVEMATRYGAKVIVVVAPVPPDQVRDSKRAAFEERTAMFGRVVEAAGGELIDLHALLLHPSFRDLAGHYRPSGHVRIANAVAAPIHRALGLPPPKLLRVPEDPPRRPRSP